MVNKAENTGEKTLEEDLLADAIGEPSQAVVPEADMSEKAAKFKAEAKKLIATKVMQEVIADPSTKELPNNVIRTIIIARCRKLFALVFGSSNAVSEKAA